MQLKQALEEFQGYLKAELNRPAATIHGYTKDLRIFLKYLEKNGQGDIPVEKISSRHLSDYLRHLTKEKSLRPNTVKRRLIALRSLFNFLVESEYLKENPAADLPRPRLPQRHPRYLSKEEVEKMLATFSELSSPSALRDKTILMCLYYTGLRAKELVSLKIEDIDFQEKMIAVKNGKGGRFRRVPLHPLLESRLQQYLAEAPAVANGYLFCNRQGLPLSTDYVHHFVKECARKAGLKKKVTPHMLRHTFATHLYRRGVDVFTLAKLLGHVELRSTSIYTHTDLEHLRQAVEKLPVPLRLKVEIAKMEGENHGA